MPREYPQVRLDFTPCRAVISPSAAFIWEAQMLCWLSFGEHEALKRDLKRAGILIPAQGIPTSTARIYLADGRETPLRRTPRRGSNALLAIIGEHEALKRDLKRAGVLITG